MSMYVNLYRLMAAHQSLCATCLLSPLFSKFFFMNSSHVFFGLPIDWHFTFHLTMFNILHPVILIISLHLTKPIQSVSSH